VYGGKSKGNKILGDVYAFGLENFTWVKVPLYGNVPDPSFNHSSVIYSNKLYIYGGLNQHFTMHSKLRVLELGNLLFP
jgi:N-acetylneuraminic acid mutarotase